MSELQFGMVHGVGQAAKTLADLRVHVTQELEVGVLGGLFSDFTIKLCRRRSNVFDLSIIHYVKYNASTLQGKFKSCFSLYFL